MVRLLFILGIVILVVTIYSVIDIVVIDRFRVRGVPKAAWLALVVLVPVAGVLLWFIVGRARASATRAPVLAPDDDPRFLARLKRELSDDDPPAGGD